MSLSLPPSVSGVLPSCGKLGKKLRLVAGAGILSWQPVTERNGKPAFCQRKIMRRGLHVESLSVGEKAVAPEVGSGSKEGEYDAIVIGSGIGGLVAATQLAVKGAKVLALEKYVIPGGSSGYYQRDGYTGF